MKSSKGFNLVSIILIICITSIASAITVGVIITNNYGLNYGNLANDKELSEFLRAYSNIVDNYYDEIDKEAMLDSAIDAMLNYLGDDYTTYLNDKERQDLEERLSGTYKGIGVSVQGKVIVAVTEGGPAEKAGVLAGDQIISIDGTNITNAGDNAVLALIRNSKKEKVTIEVKRGEEIKTFEIPLSTLIDSSIVYQMIKDTNVGYIGIDIFSRTLDTQVEKALRELEAEGMEKLIIDLRNNTGGYLDIAKTTASLFIEKGKLIYSLEGKDKKENYYDETDAKRDYPIVIIINGNSASASEILAAALKDNNNAILVGETSFGKGKVQQTYELEDGSLAKYTSAKWLRPNGECIDGIGLRPDHVVTLEYEKDEEGNDIATIDTQFNKALEVISAM